MFLKELMWVSCSRNWGNWRAVGIAQLLRCTNLGIEWAHDVGMDRDTRKNMENQSVCITVSEQQGAIYILSGSSPGCS